jgi:acetoin utilization protein AcuB
MFVGERMSRPVLTITPDTPVQEALARMRKDKVRRYPVVDKGGKLLGIITDTDLMNASPSDATTLSVWEINYLLSKINVDRVMTKKVLTVTEDTPIEDAARLMAYQKIGGLPVMRADRLVGIITETDIFRMFLEMLGARAPGIRITVEVREAPGRLYELAGAIHKLGGNIVGLGFIQGESTESRMAMIKVNGVELPALRIAIAPLVEEIVDMRVETGA